MIRRDFLQGVAALFTLPLLKLNAWVDAPVGISDSIVPVNPEFFRKDDLLMIPRTGEKMIVSGIHESGVTVVRGWQSKAAAILDNDSVWILGNAQMENEERMKEIKASMENWDESPELHPQMDLIKRGD